MARKETVKRFEVWIADEANVDLVLELVAGGLTLQKASREVKQPYTCLHPWFHSTPERQGRYEAARKAWADSKMDEALEIADGVKADKEEVAKAKLQCEVRANQAKAYNRERWGDKLQVDRDVTLTVDAGLVGLANELLLVGKRVPVVLENVPGSGGAAEVAPAGVALPAPAVVDGQA